MSETLTFTLYGGKGKGPAYSGRGGWVDATLTIDSGTTLYLGVGGNGTTYSIPDMDDTYNGGGIGYNSGGGATHVALQTGTLEDIGEANKSNVLIVAGGGGGSGSFEGAANPEATGHNVAGGDAGNPNGS